MELTLVLPVFDFSSYRTRYVNACYGKDIFTLLSLKGVRTVGFKAFVLTMSVYIKFP